MNNETLKRIYNDYAKNAAILEQPVLSFSDWVKEGLKRISQNTQYGWSQHLKQS